ncbi:TPA: hypothetical protein ROY17_005652 [Bacillus thuringiensis]|nr:hypothetical protein [Bacillus thuringiensis]
MNIKTMYKVLATTALVGQIMAAPIGAHAQTASDKVNTEVVQHDVKNGLSATYFKDKYFKKVAFISDKPGFEMNKSEIEDLLIPEEQKFQSVRWIGVIKAPKNGEYLFSSSADQDAKIEVDGKVVTDKKINLEKDKFYRVRIEYRPKQESTTDKLVNFKCYWSISDDEKTEIPTENLFLPDLSQPVKKYDANLFGDKDESVFYGDDECTITSNDEDCDWDDDGIPNGWEYEGYSYNNTSLVRWKSLKDDKKAILPKYRSNPNLSHTAGDPFSDRQKATGYMGGGESQEARNPQVAAYPEFRINLDQLVVSPTKHVSLDKSESKSTATSTTATDSKTEESGTSLGMNVEIGIKNVGFGVSQSFSESSSTSHSVSVTNDTSNGTSVSTSEGYDTGHAALVNANITYENTGTAPIYNGKPTINLEASDGTVLFTAKSQDNTQVNHLAPGGTYGPIAFRTSDQFENQPIALTLDQLTRYMSGEPMKIKFMQFVGDYQTFDKDRADWSKVTGDIQDRTATLVLDAGKDSSGKNEILDRRIAVSATSKTKNEFFTPETTLKEAIKIAFNAKEDAEGNLFYSGKNGKTIHFVKGKADFNVGNKIAADEVLQQKSEDPLKVVLRPGMKITITEHEEAAKTGWKTIEGKKYYFDTEDSKHKGKLILDGKTYYLDSSTGELQTGWKTIEGKKYYFDPSASGIMKTGWLTLSDKKYYLNSDGSLQTTLKLVDGKAYKFDPNDGHVLGEVNGQDIQAAHEYNKVLLSSKSIAVGKDDVKSIEGISLKIKDKDMFSALITGYKIKLGNEELGTYPASIKNDNTIDLMFATYDKKFNVEGMTSDALNRRVAYYKEELKVYAITSTKEEVEIFKGTCADKLGIYVAG